MNNIYFQHLNIGMSWVLKDQNFFSKLKPTIENKTAAHWKLNYNDLSEDFLNWLDSHSLSVYYAELFYCASKENIFLHIDEIDPVDCCKMNWVYDQDETWMRWAKLKEGKQIHKRNNTIGGTYYTANDGDYDYIEKARIGQPTLVNAYHLHDVINPSNYDRWCVSIVPAFKHIRKSRLTMQEACEIFKPYFS